MHRERRAELHALCRPLNAGPAIGRPVSFQEGLKMSNRQFVLVVYDISVDRRRTKLHQALLDFGAPVQYSVFECWVTPEQWKKLKARVRKVIRPRKDHVRYYPLCAACVQRIETTQAGEVTAVQSAVIV
jgi:CRISPR-associated protein Cas2